jgi:predicted lipoprotein with Yx(FWY)xxD motif
MAEVEEAEMSSGRRNPARPVAAAVAASAVGLLMLSACGAGAASSASSGGSAPSKSAGGGGGTAASGRIAVGSTSAGKVLVDPHGMTLYAFAADTRGHSTCSGSCATYWPPVPGADATGKPAARVSAHLGTLKRADGSTQLTVNGFPMYTYAGDSAPGQATGQGKNLSGGLWWVVSPTGSWVKTQAPAPSSGGGGGAGGGGGGTGGY